MASTCIFFEIVRCFKFHHPLRFVLLLITLEIKSEFTQTCRLLFQATERSQWLQNDAYLCLSKRGALMDHDNLVYKPTLSIEGGFSSSLFSDFCSAS